MPPYHPDFRRDGADLTYSRCCLTQNSPMKVRFLPKEAGTNRRPLKARVKGPKGSQNHPTKGPKVPPCQADFHGDSVDLTWQVLLDARISDEGALLLPRGRDGF